ncbi:MAG: phosphopantothenoylcysteine decarboxylase [Lentisphaeria bacterium]|nr:phosphopantothenoylcysteine decarboxylase [Lentisphaeria bacterium]
MKKNIVLGVTGGIAAYKSAELCSMLVKNGFEVKVIMSRNATRFVTPLTFQTLSKNEVAVELFDIDDWKPEHVNLAEWCELFVVAPATANFIGKMANGIADDAISTFAITCDSIKLIAPAMNPKMWQNPAVQRNCETLKNDSVIFIGPASGHVACGKDGVGRMSEVSEIYNEIVKYAE